MAFSKLERNLMRQIILNNSPFGMIWVTFEGNFDLFELINEGRKVEVAKYKSKSCENSSNAWDSFEPFSVWIAANKRYSQPDVSISQATYSNPMNLPIRCLMRERLIAFSPEKNCVGGP